MKIAPFALSIISFLLLCTLSAAEYSTRLQNAKKAIESDSKPRIWKGYHEYQSLYTKGLLDSNKALQKEALLGLIEASKSLGLDSTRYENTLKNLEPGYRKDKNNERVKKSIQKQENIDLNIKAKALDVAVVDSKLKFKLSKSINKKGIKHFILERRGNVLYVFDFKNIKIPFAIKRIKGSGFVEIRIAQFDPKTVRVVIEVKKAYKPKVDISDKTLFITLPKGSKGSSIGKKQPKKAIEVASIKVTPPKYLRRFTVVIDPGHGGRDGGAVGVKEKLEKDVTLSLSKRLKKVLQKRGFKVYLTREKDKYLSLKQRTKFANKKDADFFLSIHANAAPKKRLIYKYKGIETYFLSPARSERAKRVAAIENSADIEDLNRYTKNTYLNFMNREKIIESNKLAIDLQKQILASLRKKYKRVVDNGVREAPFWVLVGAQMPAVLIEIGYITHPTEGLRLFNPNYQELLAEGIANGIESYIYHNGM